MFGWHGFQFERPVDWEPITLSGRFETGYVKLVGPAKSAIHVRWVPLRSGATIESAANTYVSSLERDAKRKKLAFQSKIELESGRVDYRWTAHLQARGTVFKSDETKRLFFVEATGDRKDQLLPIISPVRDSFRVSPVGEPILWSALGLTVRIPSEFSLEHAKALAGSTRLTFKGRGVTLMAARQGLANEALSGQSVSDWLKDRFPKRARISELDVNSCELVIPARLKFLAPSLGAFHRFEPEENRMMSLTWSTRRPLWRPEWDWLG